MDVASKTRCSTQGFVVGRDVFLGEPERRSEMTAFASAPPVVCPRCWPKLRHSAGRGGCYWPDWLLYQSISPFARVLVVGAYISRAQSYTHAQDYL